MRPGPRPDSRSRIFYTAAFNIFTSFTCLLFTQGKSLYWRGVAPVKVEEFPPFDGGISPFRRKNFPSYRGRISLPIVEGNRELWKDLPGRCGRNSPPWWKDFPSWALQVLQWWKEFPSFMPVKPSQAVRRRQRETEMSVQMDGFPGNRGRISPQFPDRVRNGGRISPP